MNQKTMHKHGSKLHKLPNIPREREDPLPRRGSGALLPSLEISNML